MSSVDYSNWKVADLKTELKSKVKWTYSDKTVIIEYDATLHILWVFIMC